MPRPTDVTRSPLALAIQLLREHHEQTQQEFANRLGLSLGTLARYETNALPSIRRLRSLRDLATEAGRHDLAEFFTTYISTALDRRSHPLHESMDQNRNVVLYAVVLDRFLQEASPAKMRKLSRFFTKQIEEWSFLLDTRGLENSGNVFGRSLERLTFSKRLLLDYQHRAIAEKRESALQEQGGTVE